MDTAPNGLRRLPLRIAGSIGIVSSLFYLGGVLGQSDTAYIPQAIFWFSVMALAGAAAWFADRSMVHGRKLAKGATLAFFLLGLMSSVVLAVAFVAAVVLAVAGIAGTSDPRMSLEE